MFIIPNYKIAFKETRTISTENCNWAESLALWNKWVYEVKKLKSYYWKLGTLVKGIFSRNIWFLFKTLIADFLGIRPG